MGTSLVAEYLQFRMFLDRDIVRVLLLWVLDWNELRIGIYKNCELIRKSCFSFSSLSISLFSI